MRLLRLTLLSLVAASTTLACATPVPVGTYTLSASTTTTGVHQSVDQGTLTGTLTFDASSSITSANLIFNDVTSGHTFSFTNPGPTSPPDPDRIESAIIFNAVNPAIEYFFSVRVPSNPNGSFTLTCGVDCDNDVEINNGAGLLNEEVTGSITPAAATVTPEPSSLMLLGTGVLATLGAARRRLLRN